MVHRHGPVPDQVVPCLALEISRQDLALDEGLHGLGISELAGDLHAPAQGRQVAGISEHVGVDLHRLLWACRLQPKEAPAFRPHQARSDGPNVLNRMSPGNFGKVGRLDMPDMEVRRVELWTALYEEVGLCGVVARGERPGGFPQSAADDRMILEVLADAR